MSLLNRQQPGFKVIWLEPEVRTVPEARDDPPAQRAADDAPVGGSDRYWRTLDELVDDPSFAARLHDEFPSAVEAIADPVERRTFLRLMGASLGLAGLTACTQQPPETIVPYVRQPEEIVPGQPLRFSTAMTLGGIATGVVVESHEGRPTKVEGNVQHPDSLGASDSFGQASILDLYDPHRAREVTHRGTSQPWSTFIEALKAALMDQGAREGVGLRILTEAIGSPTLAAQIQEVLRAYPKARWHQWDPASRQAAHAGAVRAFGASVDTQYRVAEADVVVALGADGVGSGPGWLRRARDLATRRRPDGDRPMNRLYAIETMPTAIGARADHRLALRPSEIAAVALELWGRLGGIDAAAPRAALTPYGRRFVEAVLQDLQAHRGRSLLVVGDSQPPDVHALAHVMNVALGNVGRTVVYTDPVTASPVDQFASLTELTRDMMAGEVTLLVIVSANPAYSAPADLPFADAMAKVALTIHMSRYADETSALSHWHLPESHFLEAWSDARGSDGTVSIVQPLITPLYASQSPHELFAAMAGRPDAIAYDLVREHWMRRLGAGTVQSGALASASGGAASKTTDPPEPTPQFEAAWRKWLHDGVVANTALPERRVTLDAGFAASLERELRERQSPSQASPASPTSSDGSSAKVSLDSLEVHFQNDPCVVDGRFAGNAWLQELPTPITKLTWDNAVLVSPATAVALGVRTSLSMQGGERGQTLTEKVELEYRGRTVVGALFPVVGHPDGCATLHLGHGRRHAGPVGTGTGFDANRLRVATAPWSDRGLTVTRTGRSYSLACTQAHHLMEGRDLVRAATRDELARDPHAMGPEPAPAHSLVPEHAYDGYKWGMAIDVNACLGCSACVVGCQAENNIPVVGKAQVLRGREMHWLRIDTYYRGRVEQPESYHQPVPCMHCENAPCEVVCPVNATVHSDEGLNDMVYNRCVGTRYCSNNCPYKVRRFNYHLYQDWQTPSLKLGRNPDVTVRSRGVMEKCTYCVQRINEAKIAAEKEDRKVRDGDITPACQAVCPADAIVFGDLSDPASRVARLTADARRYTLLPELNARPRTSYLGAVRNPHPGLADT